MKRRDFLAGTASAAALLAGCSGSGGKGTEENGTEAGTATETGTSDLPEPEERDYRSIDHGEDLPQGIENRAEVAEEYTDRLVFDDYSTVLEREESYVEVSDEGTQTVVRDADGEQVEQDLYGLDISVDASEQLEPGTMQEFAVDALEDIAPIIHQAFYDPESDIPEENPITELSVNVNDGSSYGTVSYEMEKNTLGGDSIDDFRDTVLTYLEEGEGSNAIQESVEENFQYAVQ